ncbi:MAG: DUF2088 domain-containing protein [Phycisphaerales bacterium]|nr:DUF2088 domain-containing protein [Phycisphaerales bacterium]
MDTTDRQFGVNWRVLGPPPPPSDQDSGAVLREAIRAGRPSFREWIDGAARATSGNRAPSLVLVINDSHRATNTAAALRELWPVLSETLETTRISALVATGSHAPTDAERGRARAIFAEAAFPIDDITVHSADDAASHVRIGDAYFNCRLVPPCAALAIGSVEPHYFAGLTGAHKTATIGVISRDDIARNHELAMTGEAAPFALAGNPVHDGIMSHYRAMRAAGVNVLALNLVQTGAAITDAALGDAMGTLEALGPRVAATYSATVAEPVELMWLRVPAPLGDSLYQADKALQNNAGAVRDGGGILLEAACPKGVGPDRFFQLLRAAATHAAVAEHIARAGYQLGDHKALRLRHLTDPVRRGLRIAVAGAGLRDADARIAGMRAFGDVETAIKWFSKGESPVEHTRALRVEDAGNFVVQLNPQTE